MKKFIIIIVFLFITVPIYAQDSTGIDLGHAWELKIEKVQFGAVTRAETDKNSNAILRVDPIMSAGLSLSIIQRGQWGLKLFGLFYTDAEEIYPIPAIGGVLLNVSVAIGYDFGRIEGKNNCKNRLLFMVTYNPFD